MATTRQKKETSPTVKQAPGERARALGEEGPKKGQGLSTADENRLPDSEFAFPEERKEPLSDAGHVRNAIARFDQVEDVSDAERDRAWKRIMAAAKRFGVEVAENDWRELFKGGRSKKRKGTSDHG